jgi:hypothetical protein
MGAFCLSTKTKMSRESRIPQGLGRCVAHLDKLSGFYFGGCHETRTKSQNPL